MLRKFIERTEPAELLAVIVCVLVKLPLVLLQLLKLYPDFGLGVIVASVVVVVPLVTPFINRLLPDVAKVAPVITFLLVGDTVPLFVSLLANVILYTVVCLLTSLESL